jgi:hypothetical protein
MHSSPQQERSHADATATTPELYETPILQYSLSCLRSRHSHLTTLRDSNLLRRPLVARTHILNLAHNIQALNHFAENDVLAIQMRRRSSQNEELAAISVGARILRVFVSEIVRG